ncbi:MULTISPECIES: helix-turn-helix domain-containing protein [Halobacterium]|uniref:HTH-10 family transcription regulator n=3 Tax=Halobacterium salinarum TaxID=2242 RepID=Q9HSR5_HALSA|nr:MULTISPECIES: helix-turn-helix domain-containing protein [Halobacterium]AAG18738.1 hypothetical protein VNG_0113H [Halobacterium salinarum NRC-1]MBB6091037.1 hypothetical protein [Halobacterium salinarum]QRY24896.1 helix-turn-helix domain-containing protein [Halobacterium sp. BOL4-2]UEB92155.1 helix-turn-helix domain-containing protein [Halobacterium salinarum NRC-34001]CAP12994.1 HTH-10 family transcription regulator [Halobacterium salinarum R1]
MAIVAEILLADPDLPLVSVADAIPSGELSISNSVPLDDGRLLFTIRVAADSQAAFEDEARAHPQVASVSEIGATADGWFYRIIVADTTGLVASHDPAEFEGVALEATVTADGIHEQKVFSDYDALATLRDRCAVNDIPFELVAIASDPEHPGERDQFGLTDKQYRAIRTAFARGYYDSPRQCSTRELAAELGVSAAAASDLLRRAERQLIGETVGPEHARPMHAP